MFLLKSMLKRLKNYRKRFKDWKRVNLWTMDKKIGRSK